MTESNPAIDLLDLADRIERRIGEFKKYGIDTRSLEALAHIARSLGLVVRRHQGRRAA